MAPGAGLQATQRRAFLRVAAGAVGAFTLEFCLHGVADAAAPAAPVAAMPAGDVLNAYVRIHPDGSMLLFAKNPDCGQGIKTTFGMILAEELDADWKRVRVEQAPVADTFGPQSSGGSNSTPTNWDRLRLAAAAARAMLVSAAAQRLGVPASALVTRDGEVIHAASGRHLSYGELAADAARQPVPEESSLVLKKRTDYRLLGTRVAGVDNLAFVTGKPVFGIDIDVPGMLHAMLERCPARGGRPLSANLEEIRALPGIRAAFFVKGWPTASVTREAKEPPGVAIVGTSTWAVISARRKLKVEWDETGAARESWTEMTRRARALTAGAGHAVCSGQCGASARATHQRLLLLCRGLARYARTAERHGFLARRQHRDLGAHADSHRRRCRGGWFAGHPARGHHAACHTPGWRFRPPSGERLCVRGGGDLARGGCACEAAVDPRR